MKSLQTNVFFTVFAKLAPAYASTLYTKEEYLYTYMLQLALCTAFI